MLHGARPTDLTWMVVRTKTSGHADTSQAGAAARVYMCARRPWDTALKPACRAPAPVRVLPGCVSAGAETHVMSCRPGAGGPVPGRAVPSGGRVPVHGRQPADGPRHRRQPVPDGQPQRRSGSGKRDRAVPGRPRRGELLSARCADALSLPESLAVRSSELRCPPLGCRPHGRRSKCGDPGSSSLQVPTVINGDAISEVGYVLGTSADNFRSAYLEAAFVDNLVSFLGVLRSPVECAEIARRDSLIGQQAGLQST